MKLCIEISDSAFEELARMIAAELALTLANSTVDTPGAYGVNREEMRLAEQLEPSPAESLPEKAEEAEARKEKDPPATKEDAVSVPATRDDVVAELVGLGKVEGRGAVVEALAHYGCTTVSMLEPEQYGPIIEEARKARG